MDHRFAAIGAALLLAVASIPGRASELIGPASQRFATDEVTEVPDFQRHVLPLLGRLGCNGRACHGSFQGQGGFRLSLFGYDFQRDHEALLKDGSNRVDLQTAEGSMILQKPTMAIPHKGGKRLEEGSWQYQMLLGWIENGAKGVTSPVAFERLEVIPSEIVFEREGQKVPLKVVAHWADGTAEDVTCITRFRSNDDSIAEIDAEGMVTSQGKGDTHVVAFYDNGVAVTQVLLPVTESVGPRFPVVATPTRIDELVVAKLRKLGIVPSGPCNDAEFLRRVSLDLTGTLPLPREVEAFLDDSASSASKRERKVDELLKSPAYAAWWTTRLCDITGNNARNFQGQGNANELARHWYEWIYRRVADNVPYDRLVEGIVLATSRRPSQSYDDFAREMSAYFRDKDPADYSEHDTMPYFWAKRMVRKPEEKALNFSYTFLGVRLECAQCHKHPFDQWTQDDFNGFTAFFNGIGYNYSKEGREHLTTLQKELNLPQQANQAQRELAKLVKEGKVVPWPEVFVTRRGQGMRGKGPKNPAGEAGRVLTPRVLGGESVALDPLDDPREPLMEWMRSKTNPYFARAFINRVWANDFGSGIINPPDDMNLANPPSNAALLDYLADEFINHHFDMKWLHREIVTSQAYQRSWKTNETNQLDERNFSRAIIRRLPAEVLVDAVNQATAGGRELASAATDLDTRAIGPKAGIGLGRPGGGGDYAARIFGASARDTNCDCNRSNEPNLLQSIYLQNDQELLSSIERNGSWVAEVSKNSRRGRGPSTAEELENRIEKLERSLTRADNGKQVVLTTLLADELNDLRRQRKALRRRSESEKTPAVKAMAMAMAMALATATLEQAKVIREAYLRTLSRPPSDHEAEIAGNYFSDMNDPDKGLRDLLWALLNTKEFITNH